MRQRFKRLHNENIVGLCGIILILAIGAAPALRAQAGASAQELILRCSDATAAGTPECQELAGRAKSMGLTAEGQPDSGAVVPQSTTLLQEAIKQAEKSVPPPASKPGSEETSEFQRYVSASVGRPLPIFGASLFDSVPTTFAPVERAPITADYVIGPGDVILLRAWGQVNVNLQLEVDRLGQVYIPQVGNLTVAGLTYQQLPGFLRSEMGRVYRNFEISVNMGQLRSIQILVLGYAKRPGSYTISALSTLVNALFASGGPSFRGTMRRIQLKRGNGVVSELDLYDLLIRGDKSKDIRLLPGDVVFIPPAGRQVAVAGAVRNPAIFELKDEATAGELIELAGGLAPTADPRRVVIERINSSKRRIVLEIDLTADGRSVELLDADVMRVDPIPPQFEQVVTLRGHVANPGRFRWREGMRLRDVIPNKESLITRGYWSTVNQAGFTPVQSVESTGPAGDEPSILGVNVNEILWSYATIERQSPRRLTPDLLQFNLGKLVLEKDEEENRELLPGDVITIYSTKNIRIPAADQAIYVRVDGEVKVPGTYRAFPGETLGQIVMRAGGLTDRAYLYAAEFTRESARAAQRQRLEQFIAEVENELASAVASQARQIRSRDEAEATGAQLAAQRQVLEQLRRVQPTGRVVLGILPGETSLERISNISLENRDSFYVPPRPVTVNVFGAVYNPTTILYAPGKRVLDYLRETGCCTRNADRGRMFIIRANGSIEPKRRAGLFGKTFESIRLNPGDSIVVPPKVPRGSFATGLRDWTQIFGQLALGAASINVITR